MSVAFVTSAYSRDWPVVLAPDRFRMNVASSRHAFTWRLVVLNNFRDEREFRSAELAAQRLVANGLADAFIHAPTYLTDERLLGLGIAPKTFWAANPFFSTSHLAALDYLRGQTEWMFFLNGDVWLERECEWIERAQKALAAEPQVRGLNLCRNIYRNLYARDCHRQTHDLWISDTAWRPGDGERCGFALSHHAYLLPVSPLGGWNFSASSAEMEAYRKGFPAYAMPCFELFFCVAMKREGFAYAALKPDPVTKHKTFSKYPLKLAFHRLCGSYSPRGMYSTRPAQPS